MTLEIVTVPSDDVVRHGPRKVRSRRAFKSEPVLVAVRDAAQHRRLRLLALRGTDGLSGGNARERIVPHPVRGLVGARVVDVRVVDVCALRAAVVVADRGVGRHGRIDRVDAAELRVHPVVVPLVEVDERDVARTLRDLVLHPRLARLGDALERPSPRRGFGVPRRAPLDRRDDDKVCTGRVSVRKIRLEVVRVALHAGFVVSVLDVEVVARLQKARLTVRPRARGEPALALVAYRQVRGSVAREAGADAGVVLEREVRRRVLLVRAGGVGAEPHRPPHVHLLRGLSAHRARNLRTLRHRERGERGVRPDDADVDRVVVVRALRLVHVRRELDTPRECARLAGGEGEMVRLDVLALGEERHVGVRRGGGVGNRAGDGVVRALLAAHRKADRIAPFVP